MTVSLPAVVAATAVAATAVATRPATATPTAAAAAAAAAATVLRLVHANAAPVELGAVHRIDGGVCVFRRGERDEPKSTRPTRVTVGDHFRVVDRTVRLERCSQALVRRIPAQTTDK